MAENTFHGCLPSFKGFATLAIHAGQEPDAISGAVITPISLSTTFAQKSPGHHTGYEYSRTGNPTRNTFEKNIAACEGGKHGLCFGSGLAATMTITNLFKTGDKIICCDDVYGGTQRYFLKIASNLGLKFEMVDLNNVDVYSAALTSDVKMVWIESPTNPTLKLVDIQETVKRAKAVNSEIIVVVDNTFMSPYFQRPLDLGADLVLHSITKYINGHSDVVMGVVVTNSDELNTRLRYLQNGIGAVPSPFDAFMAMRGLKTLHVRMREHEKNAFAVARFLEVHSKVEKVFYPGLPSHPQHELAKKQMTGFGGMITFFLKGESKRFLENLKIFALAESLGGVESLAEHPAIMTHASVPPESRKKLGISDSLVRLSVGIEDVEDLLNDIKNALDAV